MAALPIPCAGGTAGVVVLLVFGAALVIFGCLTPVSRTSTGYARNFVLVDGCAPRGSDLSVGPWHFDDVIGQRIFHKCGPRCNSFSWYGPSSTHIPARTIIAFKRSCFAIPNEADGSPSPLCPSLPPAAGRPRGSAVAATMASQAADWRWRTMIKTTVCHEYADASGYSRAESRDGMHALLNQTAAMLPASRQLLQAKQSQRR